MFHPIRSFSQMALSLALVALAASPLRAGTAPDELSEFTKELQKSLSSRQSDQNYGRDIVGQFGALDAALRRGDFERAQQLLQNLSGYGVPPELQSKWQSLADKLAEAIVEQQQQHAIEWKKLVDALVKKTREACMTAKSSADLDEVMVDIAAQQLKRTRSSNLLAQRASQKIEALARFVDQWSRFLDFREAGDAKQANNILRNLSQSGSDFPMLSATEIQKAFVEETISDNPAEAARKVFVGVDTLEAIPPAVTRLTEILKDPAVRNQNQGWNTKNLLLLVEADNQAQAGAFADARASLQRVENDPIFSNLPGLGALRDQVTERVRSGELLGITGATLKPGETTNTMLTRVLDQLKAESKYAEMARIISQANKLPRPRTGYPSNPWSSEDATALIAFATASQFDQAGDAFPAVVEYRRVISTGQTGKYAPTKEAQAALERLQKSNPDVLKDVNSVVLEELRQIRQIIMQLRTRQPGERPGMYQ